MNTQDTTLDLSSLRRRLLIVLFGSLFALVGLGMNATPAQANYYTGSQGSGGGSGSCSFSTGWNFSSSWPSAVSQTHGCSGTTMNNGMSNRCSGQGGLVGVWWLGDRNSPGGNWWTQIYQGGNDEPGVWSNAVRNLGNVSSAGRDYVINNNGGSKTILWLCESAGTERVIIDPERPVESQPNCDDRNGYVTIPNHNQDNTVYRIGGRTLTPRSTHAIQDGDMRVEQYALGNNVFSGGGDSKERSWRFTSTPIPRADCIIDIVIRVSTCRDNGDVPDSGVMTVVSAPRSNMYTLRSRARNISEGDTVSPILDGETANANVYDVRDGWIIRINGSATTSWESSVQPTCSNTGSTASVEFSDPIRSCTAGGGETWTRGSWTQQGNRVTWASSGNTTGDVNNASANRNVTVTATASSGSQFTNAPPGATLNSGRTVATWTHTWTRPAGGDCSQATLEDPSFTNCSPSSTQGSVSIPSTGGTVTYTINGTTRGPGVYTYASGSSVSVVGRVNTTGASQTWSHTFTASGSCGSVTTSTQYDNDTVTWYNCYNGTEVTYVPTTTTSSPYAYSWSTVVEGREPHPGPTTFTGVSASKLTPIGQLLQNAVANDRNPTAAEMNNAQSQTATATHASVPDIAVDNNGSPTRNYLFLAEGGIMDVSEFTQYVVLEETTIMRQDTPWSRCDRHEQDRYRTRTVTTTRTPNPTTYTVQIRNRYDTNAQAGDWNQTTRTRNTGTHCGANNQGARNGTHPVSGEGPGSNHAVNGGTCTNVNNGNSINNYRYWGPWNSPSTVRVSSCTEQDFNTGGTNTVRTCSQNPGTPGSTGTWTAWSTTSTTANVCPNPMSGSTNNGTTTMRYEYNCTANPVTFSTSTSYGSWGSWRNTGSERIYYGVRNYGTPTYSVDSYSYETQAAGQELTGFWQSLSNHCNATGYSTATNGRSNVTLENSGDSTRRLSASAVSPKLTISGGSANVWWGEGAQVANPAGTNQDGFFDKECAYEGRRVGTNERAAYNHFRDNERYDVNVDLYRPVGGGVVSNVDKQALRTIVSRWNLGTPAPTGSTGATMKTVTEDNQQVFKAFEDSTAPILRNWGSTPSIAGPTWGFLDGQHSTFVTSGNWASEGGRPNVFAVKWEYDPTLSNRVPTTNVGFAGTGGARSYSLGTVSADIRGIVYGRQDGANSPAEYVALEANTGSSVSANNMDVTLPKGTDVSGNRWNSRPHEFSPYYTTVTFIRAVGS